MEIETVYSVYFSPTGTTRVIVEGIKAGMGVVQTETVDLTKNVGRHPYKFTKGIVIIGTPVYYGRVPEEVAACLATFKAEHIPAALVVVYGNRAYDDALKELYDIASAGGFVPIACGAFIGEHSYSSSTLPIAKGRPDKIDLEKAGVFGNKIREKMLKIEHLKKTDTIKVPGKFPYIEPKTLYLIKDSRKTISYAPETDTSLCIKCGKCVEVCPTGAVSREEPSIIDKWQCIICQACVKYCPSGAKQMKNETFDSKVRWIYDNCKERKEPEWYL